MTPAVRRLLREHELTAAQIVGTGGGGRITREDVLKVVESIRTGIPVGPSAFDGYAATATAGACLAALASGKKTAIGLQERPSFYKDPA